MPLTPTEEAKASGPLELKVSLVYLVRLIKNNTSNKWQ